MTACHQQSTFVKGRHILYEILIANKVVDEARKLKWISEKHIMLKEMDE